MPVKMGIKGNLRAIAGLNDLLRRATHATLKDVAKLAKKESVKEIINSKYSSSPKNVITNRIYTNISGSPRTPIWKISSSAAVRGGDIPPMYMNLSEKPVATSRGKRWAVYKGGTLLKGAFHLKSTGQKQLRQAGGTAWTPKSKLFVTANDGSLVQYKFKTFSEVIQDRGAESRIYNVAKAKMDQFFIRNEKRYRHLWTEQLKVR